MGTSDSPGSNDSRTEFDLLKPGSGSLEDRKKKMGEAEPLPGGRGEVPRTKADPADAPRRILDKCPDCGDPLRIVSKPDLGVNGHCNKCKKSWPITIHSRTTLMPTPLEATRGMSKETFVEPDWDLAFEDLDDDPFGDFYD